MKRSIFDKFVTLKNGSISNNKTVNLKQQNTKLSTNYLKFLSKKGFINGFLVKKNKVSIFINFDKFSNTSLNSLKIVSKRTKKGVAVTLR